MDYLSTNWNNLNLDSIVEVLQFGRHKKAFHNVFLDYREFHPPVSEISSIIGDGSISLISNNDIKIQLISLMDTGFDVPGTTAKFCTPVIPGPEIKKAKTSLKLILPK